MYKFILQVNVKFIALIAVIIIYSLQANDKLYTLVITRGFGVFAAVKATITVKTISSRIIKKSFTDNYLNRIFK